MNIGVVVDNDLNDDKRVLREINILRDAGHNIHALCFGFDGKKYLSPEGITVTRINISKKYKDTLYFFLNLIPVYEWLWASWIKKFIIENKIDVIHAHDLYMSKCSHDGIRRSGKKVSLVLDLHENYPFVITTYNWTKGFLRSLITNTGKWKKKEGKYLSYADRIVVLSEDFKNELTERYPGLKKENFCALPNFPDILQMSSFGISEENIPFRKKNPVLFYFGVVAERRGIFDALSAFARVIDEGHRIDFMIIGPVDKKDLPRFNSMITSGSLKNNVIYIPWIDLSELPSYLSISDICIAPFHKNPQHESGVANKIYDYMLGGKPLIVSDCLPQRNLVEKYNCGIVFRNENELAGSIIQLLEDEPLRKRMGENGHRAILNSLNTDQSKSDLLAMYRSLHQTA